MPSKQWSKGRYLHYQRKLSTHLIHQPAHPRYHPRLNTSDWLDNNWGCCGNRRDFGSAPDDSLKGDCHGRGAQRRAYFRTPRDVSRMGRDGTTPGYGNTSVEAARLTFPVQICHSNTDSPSRTGNQEIINPRGAVSPQWIRNAEKLKASINGFFAEDRGPTPIFSKVVGWKFTEDSSSDVNSRCGVNFGSDTVFTQNPNFVNFGLASINTTDKLESFSVPTTRVGGPNNSSNWIRNGHDI